MLLEVRFCRKALRPGSALVDPTLDGRDFRGGQRLRAHRHARLIADSGDSLVERRLLVLTGVNGFGRRVLRVEAQRSQLNLRAVTSDARTLQDGLHVRGEVNFFLGARGGREGQHDCDREPLRTSGHSPTNLYPRPLFAQDAPSETNHKFDLVRPRPHEGRAERPNVVRRPARISNARREGGPKPVAFDSGADGKPGT